MSTNPKTSPYPWLATFIRGFAYTLREDGGDIVFSVNVPVPVTDKIKDHLEEHAIEDRLSSSDADNEVREITVRPMFSFAPNPAYNDGAAP